MHKLGRMLMYVMLYGIPPILWLVMSVIIFIYSCVDCPCVVSLVSCKCHAST